jgi:hypothetical protein
VCVPARFLCRVLFAGVVCVRVVLCLLLVSFGLYLGSYVLCVFEACLVRHVIVLCVSGACFVRVLCGCCG